MTTYEVRRLGWDEARADAYAVRKAVFVDEQDVPEEIELDGEDENAVHVVAYEADETPVGTARLRVVDDAGKAERVAVLSSHRGNGLGETLMDHLEDEARKRGCQRMELHAQTRVEGFYDRLGYETVSDVFEEAGIPHVEMVKRLE